MLSNMKFATFFVAWAMLCGRQVLAADNLDNSMHVDKPADSSFATNGRQLLQGFEPVAPWNFGEHALDQCNNPVTTIDNIASSLTTDQFRIPPRKFDGTCFSPTLGYCIGDCVRVEIRGRGSSGRSPAINVIAGGALPDPKTTGHKLCSSVAERTNFPVGWDFTHAGKCGKGDRGSIGDTKSVGVWHNCLVHDVCVWARCTEDDTVAGGAKPITDKDGGDDPLCGLSYDHAQVDWFHANNPLAGKCTSDSTCPKHWNCVALTCKIEGSAPGAFCANDSDCRGYCQFSGGRPKCFDGKKGDTCKKNHECKLSPQKRCKKRKTLGITHVRGKCV